MGIDISVIICSYNRCDRLETVLRSLGNIRVDPHLTWEIIVVDNNSKDRTKAVVEGRIQAGQDGIRYLFEGRQGKSFALNTGIVAARGAIIAFTDDDVTVDPGWLREIKKMFDTYDCLGAGGRIIPVYETTIPRWLRLDTPFPFMNALVAFDFGNEPCVLKTPPFGANMAFRREAFEKYGPFRTDLGPVMGNTMGKGEDSEFCSRLLVAGETIMYANDAVIFHPVEQERMNRNYFKAWYFNYGIARMLRSSPTGPGTSYFGVPRFLIRRIIARFVTWMLTPDGHRRFCSKLQLYEAAGEIAGAFRKCREERKAGCTARPDGAIIRQ